MQLLAVLEQNPDARWEELVGGVKLDEDDGEFDPYAQDDGDDDGFATFRL